MIHTEQLSQNTINMVTLYRVENPNIPPAHNTSNSHPDLVGGWFSTNPNTALRYLDKSTRTTSPNVDTVDGARMIVAHIPQNELDGYHASRHPVVAEQKLE